MTGISSFMAAIEATKRAFGDVEAAERRRHRAVREKKNGGSGVGLDATAAAGEKGVCVGDVGYIKDVLMSAVYLGNMDRHCFTVYSIGRYCGF